MSDFVVEMKPRPLLNYRHPCVQPKEDFVAEIRPKSYINTDLMQTASHCYSQDDSDLYVQKMLSDGHFSREDITRLLEGSVMTLIEKLLTGRSISGIEGSLCISLSTEESPIIVNLFKPFTKSHSPGCLTHQALGSSLNVKIKDRDHPVLSPSFEKPDSSCSPCYDFNRETCQSPAGSESSLQMSLGYHSDRDSSTSSPPREFHISSPPRECHLSSPLNECNLSIPPHNISLSSLTHTNNMSSPLHTNNLSIPPHNIPLSTLTHTHNLSSPTHERNLIRPPNEVMSPPPRLEVSVTAQNKHLTENIQDKKSASTFHFQSGCISKNTNDSDIPMDVSKSMLDRSLPHLQKSQNLTDVFCGGLDGKNTLHSTNVSLSNTLSQSGRELDSCGASEEGSNAMDDYDDDDVESEHLLVIDEDPADDVRATQSSHDSSKETEEVSGDEHRDRQIMEENVLSRASLQCSPMIEAGVPESLTSKVGDVRPAVYAEVTAIDAHVDLHGNSEITSAVMSVIPHPQSLVSRQPGGFKCKRCCDILPDTTAVSVHAQAAHQLHCCTYCCRTFTAKNNLRRHVRRHTGQRPYKCFQCPKSFFRRDDLKGHMIRHDYAKPFRCSVCKKGYTDRTCVKNHMAREHRSPATLVCPTCGESFDGEDAFTFHKRSHPELKQFACSKCSFIGTNKLMTMKHALQHRHKHFSCKPCNAYFADAIHYTKHVKKHKLNTSFAQYICCFCDVAHATYDQYVRHEYSHAQSKAHADKTCKKQLRIKSLLQGRAMSHKRTVADKTVRVQSKSESRMDITKSRSQSEQNSVDKENNFFSSKTFLSSRSDEDVPRCSGDYGTATLLPTTLEESEDDDACGQLLDLSMKKASSPTFSQDGSSDGQTKNESCNTSVTAAGQLVHNFPRNGVVSAEPANLSQECEVREQRFATSHSSETEGHGGIFRKPVLVLKDHKMTSNQVGYWSRVSQSPKDRFIDVISQRKSCSPSETTLFSHSRNTETANMIHAVAQSATSDRKSFPRAMLTSTRDRLRLSPYNREKMADLAAKFMVARGTKLSGQRAPLKAIVPVGDERTAIIIRDEEDISQSKRLSLSSTSDLKAVRHERSVIEKIRSKHLARESLKDKMEVGSCDNTNLETTLRCHIPTVVKSEPTFGLVESPLDCRFKKTETENTEVRRTQGGSHSCEICSELFGTFAELESHSVEAHKRYLCEHCRKSFTARPNRDRHVRYHTGERPYRCDLCDLAFFRGDDLKYHRTTRHPTAQPFVCTHCTASFTWGRDLERHIRHSKCNV